MSTQIAPKLIAELIGTFAFVFIGAGAAAVVGDGVGLPGIAAIAFAHGLTIMALAYGSVSGAHMNPAVTMGVLAAGPMRAGDAAAYIVSQLLGGVIGALLLGAMLGGGATGLGKPALAHNLAVGATALTMTSAAGFVIEAMLAFFPVTVVLSAVVVGRRQPRAAGDRNDGDSQHHDGRPADGRRFQPGPSARPNGRNGQFHPRLAYMAAPIVGAIVAAFLHTGLTRLAEDRPRVAAPAAAPAE
jgi:glycerol uptake facilitator-like aquaporin